MPKPPKSPLENPTTGHQRRPSGSRRTSSSEKAKKGSSTASGKHGVKTTPSHATSTSTKTPSSSIPGPKASLADNNTILVHKDIGRTMSGNTSGSPAQVKEAEQGASSRVDEPPTNRGSGKSAVSFSGITSPGTTPQEEVERLRAAMNAQLLLNQQRDKLSKHLNERAEHGTDRPSVAFGKSTVSPINEEIQPMSPSLDAAFASPLPSGMETASTESNKTVRGGMTPGPYAARTPSYPFPSMKTPRNLSFTSHRPFTSLSPTTQPLMFSNAAFDVLLDRAASGSVTPASTATFQPQSPGQSTRNSNDADFPSPNLYELSLMLSSEPGLEPWWTTVCQMMKDIYRAERVTLSIPADSTDLENVPWGQKATFSTIEEDYLSLTYLPRGSSLVPSSGDLNDGLSDYPDDTSDFMTPGLSVPSTPRPDLLTRHSFTSYEASKGHPTAPSDINRPMFSSLKPTLGRSQSYLSSRPDKIPRQGTLRNAQLNLASLQEHLAFENAKQQTHDQFGAHERNIQGRVFPVLQALDYEADPLIDSSGIIRVLDRGKVIALTRDYPYLEEAKVLEEDSNSGGQPARSSGKSREATTESEKHKRPELQSRLSSFLGPKAPPGSKMSRSNRSMLVESNRGITSVPYISEDEEDGTFAPRYEEYEQTPASPWAQSPAPSPAVRADPNENPFFTNASVEDCFNPTTTPQDYSKPIQAIGIDKSCTILHIPFIHPLLSKALHASRLDTINVNATPTARDTSQADTYVSSSGHYNEASRQRHSPIAVLSILVPITPYPSNLRHSLQHLAPHLATSFSLCRHYTNLETEVAGLSRRRPQISGFGAVAQNGIPMDKTDYTTNPDGTRIGSGTSAVDSVTSPSDSGVSRSTGGSPVGTPVWGPESMERVLGGSPGYSFGDSYFTAKNRPTSMRVETNSRASITGGRRLSKESSPDVSRSARSQGEDRQASEQDPQPGDGPELPDETIRPSTSKQNRSDTSIRDMYREEVRDSSSSPAEISTRKKAIRGAASQGQSRANQGHVHTQLHSYGADFASTFQSLPATTSSGPLRTNSTAATDAQGQLDMPPPSERVKNLMLDTLPAHLFVALPQNGEIVWVNNRYLTYRGQTISKLKDDPWGSIHPDELDIYLKEWSHSLRTGEQFSMQVRIRRFDGSYRWFYTRAVGGRDTRGIIVQWYGSFMDIHDQHVAEVKAARQEEIEASEAKHRLLANLIPQIIFAATEEEGITFANERWLSYTGQGFDEALGLGFMDFVHPDDLAKCQIPGKRSATPPTSKKPAEPSRNPSETSSGTSRSSGISDATEVTVKVTKETSSAKNVAHELPTTNLSELEKNGVLKVTTDNDGRKSYTTEVRLMSKSKEYRWHLVRCVQVDNINFGSGDGSWFGACTDINDHKILEAALKDAMESKSKFLSNMSHEIRTPLIGISGMVAFLQDTYLTDEQMDYANTISTSASSLLMIINDILDISKVDSGMMKLNFEWFHPSSLIEDVHELISTLAIQKKVELNYLVDESVPGMVKGDKFRIRQVLLNVVGNAIKFTQEGEVFTSCKVYHGEGGELGRNEIMLIWSVQDTGPGFDDEQKKKMFKPFSQIDGSLTRAHGGTGLGLVISRTLVELHGGHMDGNGIPGKGATFTFTIRLRLAAGEDQPPPLLTPMPDRTPSRRPSFASAELSARALKVAGGNPSLNYRMGRASPAGNSPKSEIAPDPPSPMPTFMSSASSDPSLTSNRTQVTERSSASSINVGLARFSEAARNSQPDLSSMKLAIPEKGPSSMPASPSSIIAARPAVPLGHRDSSGSSGSSDLKLLRPPMYSILIVCAQRHSREATARHIEMTLPKDVPHQITSLETAQEARDIIGGMNPMTFTHIILNLADHDEILLLIEEIFGNIMLPQTSIVVLSDPVQRQLVMKAVPDYDYDQLAKDNRVNFIYKPVKPSRFAVIFDPDKERDLSTDRNRSNAQQQIVNQKQNYIDAEKRLGNKGHRVLLVEDNLVNQKVLLKYLGKVGVDVDLANDGVECTEMLFAQPSGFYSLILCDLQMPRKDGYQTCRDIREWEEKNKYSKMPIIALSANVMSDVLAKCNEAGFNSYVTKPVDFKSLSSTMGNLLDPKKSRS